MGKSVRRSLERSQLLAENRRYRDHLKEEVRNRAIGWRQSLPEAKNVALQEVLSTIEAGRKTMGQQLHKNVEKVILPLIRTLKQGVSRQQLRTIEQVEHGLEEIISPFIDNVSRGIASLTPTELRVCNFIKRGLAVKEIAELEHLSPETIAAHRRSIRRKLGIASRKVNLSTYLHSSFNSPDGAAVK